MEKKQMEVWMSCRTNVNVKDRRALRYKRELKLIGYRRLARKFSKCGKNEATQTPKTADLTY